MSPCTTKVPVVKRLSYQPYLFSFLFAVLLSLHLVTFVMFELGLKIRILQGNSTCTFETSDNAGGGAVGCSL